MNIYDKLSEIFDLNEKVATESVSMNADLYLETGLVTDENIDEEIKFATEDYVATESTLIGFASTLNQHIFMESISDIDTLMFTDINSDAAIFEAVNDKEDKGLLAKLKKLWELLVNNIVSMFKLMNLQSLKMLKLGKMSKNLFDKLAEIDENVFKNVENEVTVPKIFENGSTMAEHLKEINGAFSDSIDTIWAQVETHLINDKREENHWDKFTEKVSEKQKAMLDLIEKYKDFKKETTSKPIGEFYSKVKVILLAVSTEFSKEKLLKTSKGTSKSIKTLIDVTKRDFAKDKDGKIDPKTKEELSKTLKLINEFKKDLVKFENFRFEFIKSILDIAKAILKHKGQSKAEDKKEGSSDIKQVETK